MIQKFLAKYFFEVIPSIVATVVGAYIVTHYINSKADTEKPPAAISAPVKAASTPEPVKSADVKTDTVKDTAKAEPKSEPVRPAVKAASRSPDKTEKPAEKSEDAANARRRQSAREAAKDEVREKAAEAAHEAEGRDANDLARDALARLRGGSEQAKTEQAKTEQAKSEEPRSDATRTPEVSRMQEAERAQRERPQVRVVNSPSNGITSATQSSAQAPQQIPATRLEASVPPMGPPVTIAPSSQLPSYVSGQGGALGDPSRPTPPADIPLASRGRTPTSVAEDVVSAAKSMFDAVVPLPH